MTTAVILWAITVAEAAQTLGLLIGGAAAAELIRSGFQRKQMNASTAKTLTEATITLLAPLQDRINTLNADAAANALDSATLRHDLHECLDQAGRMRGALAEVRAELAEAHKEIERLRLHVYEADRRYSESSDEGDSDLST